MSEYQFYEFRSLDKPLSKVDKSEIGTWSKRTNPSNTGATFNYSYGDFPKDEITVIEKYFDAMFYISNWGTTRLIFKYPKDILDIEIIKQYCIKDGLTIIEKPNCLILDMTSSDEEGEIWIDGEERLTSLVSLREDILNGDYRSLYLIWMKNIIPVVGTEWCDNDPADLEPPVPMQLNTLNGALLEFVEVFDISKDYIIAASENSQPDIKDKVIDFETYIDKLPEYEKHEFLVRLLNDEALLGTKLKTRLRRFSDSDKEIVPKRNRRSISELAKRVEELKQERKNKKKKKIEEKRLKKLNDTELQENEYWIKVDQLIADKNSKAYDEAVSLLKDLKELAIHKNNFDDFCNKVELIRHKYSRLSSLTARISSAKLTENLFFYGI